MTGNHHYQYLVVLPAVRMEYPRPPAFYVLLFPGEKLKGKHFLFMMALLKFAIILHMCHSIPKALWVILFAVIHTFSASPTDFSMRNCPSHAVFCRADISLSNSSIELMGWSVQVYCFFPFLPSCHKVS